jgi:phosphatidylserine/phosphatidylglycerophosphate/cardiolipin synthase-like enzyme
MRVHFGGPDKPVAALAQLLLASIENVPPGGEIHWITYYFGNHQLAQSLLAASRRGVKVALNIDAHPRRPDVNRGVIELLRGLAGAPKWGLRVLRHMLPCHVHEKLYYFSHPRPAIYVGSYNPSGNRDDSAELVEDIGDQDRGHNLLVEIGDESAVSFLRSHMQAMHVLGHGPFERLKSNSNDAYSSARLGIWFYPRRKTGIHIDALKDRALRTVRVAASHFRDPTVAHRLVKLAAEGVQVELMCHESQRRVPLKIEKLLLNSGVQFVRYRHEDRLPMHNKFILLETERETSVLFGSLNLTRTSRWLNHEVLLKCSDTDLVAAFFTRWHDIQAEMRARGKAV